jgi:hypothetical protein
VAHLTNLINLCLAPLALKIHCTAFVPRVTHTLTCVYGAIGSRRAEPCLAYEGGFRARRPGVADIEGKVAQSVSRRIACALGTGRIIQGHRQECLCHIKGHVAATRD